MPRKKITSKQLEEKFDSDEDVLEYFNTDQVERPNAIQRISLDLPEWMLTLLDNEATRLGIPRQAVIKVIIDESFKKRA